ncbi:hypothetical protein S7335_1606 [Synechococcus sp. PCC 7335]|nr:hypothetical protein S7335_1606 [Synechococcus sp. PCC 7335]
MLDEFLRSFSSYERYNNCESLFPKQMFFSKTRNIVYLLANIVFSNATLIYTSLDRADADLLNAQVVNTPISIGGSYGQ